MYFILPGKVCSVIPDKSKKELPPPRLKPAVPPRRLEPPPPPRTTVISTTIEFTGTAEENDETTAVTIEHTTEEILEAANNHNEENDNDRDHVYKAVASSIFSYVTGSGFCAALATYITCRLKGKVLERFRRFRENRELGPDVRSRKKGKTSPPTAPKTILGVQTITNPFYTGTTQEEIEIMRRRPYASQGLFQTETPTPAPFKKYGSQGFFQSEMPAPTPIENLVPNLLSVPDLQPIVIKKQSSFSNPPV